jgi:hypothetical protein
MSFIDRAENEVRVLNVVPCITAIDYPKFPEEETYTPAQSEQSELNPCRSAITPALSQRVGVMSFIDRDENEVVRNPLSTPSF